MDDPPEPPPHGEYLNWDSSMSGKTTFGTVVEYVCDEGKSFEDEYGAHLEAVYANSNWNKTWYPSEVGTAYGNDL